MKILGIETSCDETAASVVEDGRKILSNVVATSSKMHAMTGGIIPEQAARQQLKSMVHVIKQALSEAFPKLPNLKSQISNLDAISVTAGPGLIGSLLVGVETSKTLSHIWQKPIIPINHLAGHIYANFIRKAPNSKFQIPNKDPSFPLLALVVSGGHTDLVLMKDHGKLKWLGGTRDDAAGEAFDKTARLLGLPYPGGPVISAQAEKLQNQKSRIKMSKFPRPMLDEENFDWSFSGLKTAVLREVDKLKNKEELDDEKVSRLAAEIQEAIVEVLVEKSIRAIKKYKPKSFLLSGGVAANKRLREMFRSRIKDEKLQVSFHVPPVALCTDNATYIAAAAYYNNSPVEWKDIKANPGLSIVEKAQ